MIQQSAPRGYKSTLKGGRVPPERLENLVMRLRAGDRSVAEEIISGHINLAHSIVAKFARQYYYKLDDLVSAAMLGLVQAVEWGLEGRLHDNNITPYIYSTVKRHIIDHLRNDHVVYIPPKAYKKMAEISIQPIVQTVDLREDPDNPDIEGYSQYLDVLTTEDEHEIIFMEILDSLGLNARERYVIDKLIEGYTLVEIGDKLGMSKQNVFIIRNKIRERIFKSELCSGLRWCSR